MPTFTVPTASYAWVITHDHLDDEDISIAGPRDASDTLLDALRAGKGRTFKMYDDDDELYFTGRIVGEYDGFEPLEDYGTPGAGCTGIRYPGSGPDYGGGRYL